MTAEEVRELLRREVDQAGGQTNFARARHIDRSTISLVLSSKHHKKPTPQILVALGLRKVTLYEPR